MSEHDKLCKCDGCMHEAVEELKNASTITVESASSQEAYHTTVKIERYRVLPVDPFDDATLEDSYCFTIGKRTFPEVLTLADDIKACVTLMRKVRE